MIKIIYINKFTRYGSLDYFIINCVDECLQILKDDMIDRTVITIVPVKNSTFLKNEGGASHSTNIFDEKFDGSRPPKLKEIISEIVICNNVQKLIGKETFKEYFQKRFFDFIESLGLEVNQYTMFTIILLHEIGHANMIKLFLELGMEKELDALYNLSMTTIRLAGSYKNEKIWQKRHKISLTQTLNAMESFADCYAFRNFPTVWNSVKHFVRPELGNTTDPIFVRFHERFDVDKKYVRKVNQSTEYITLLREIFE